MGTGSSWKTSKIAVEIHLLSNAFNKASSLTTLARPTFTNTDCFPESRNLISSFYYLLMFPTSALNWIKYYLPESLSYFKLLKTWSCKSLCKGPSLYYVSTFLGFFWPIHTTSEQIVLTISKNCHFSELTHPVHLLTLYRDGPEARSVCNS